MKSEISHGGSESRQVSMDGALRSFAVDVGGLVVGVRSADPAWLRWNLRRFGAFLTGRAPGVVFEHVPGANAPRVSRSGTLIRMEGGGHPRFLDVALTELLPVLLAPRLVFHGTLLSDQTRTYLCCGHSGAGKTTLARLLPGRSLCDELAVVRPEGARFEGISLPYWDARPGAGPLAGIFVLEHAPAHWRERLSTGEAIRQLRPHVCWPTEDQGAMIQSFTSLAELAQAVPAWRLGFRRDPGVWELITRPAP